MTEEHAQRLREEENRLFAAFGSLRDANEARAFLLDVCSPKEIEDLAQRLQVATLLSAGCSYVDVSRKTGASSTTVSRVSKCLNGEVGGYRTVLSRLEGGA
ncbi:YerC/YecD family TrpR-related protein [Parafannyhessea umbonata]|uniref:TrpR-related protein YerC/YecD n=1 Tax=Parafannyhessea umbonata TaxID=604330 RepID=A0A1H1KXY9_9ACTN|nr:YerC/YecD family TrpR-related protein [Parafannyhessea umbonata]SDR66862.1 TrpR-related protein YerC/YecD [Parafannyhessea umbonata]